MQLSTTRLNIEKVDEDKVKMKATLVVEGFEKRNFNIFFSHTIALIIMLELSHATRGEEWILHSYDVKVALSEERRSKKLISKATTYV